MRIAGLLKTSTIDFPGRLSAALFTAGCNYNCTFCHNRELIDNPPLMDNNEIEQFLQKRKRQLDGIVISGGEPTLQEDLPRFLAHLHSLDYEIKLDTNGSKPAVVRNLLSNKLVDFVAMDYKAPFNRYPEITGKSSGPVKQTLGLLISSGVEWELRTTLIPELTPSDLFAMAKALPIVPSWALQLYVPIEGDNRPTYTPLEVKELSKTLKAIQPNIFARC